MSNKYLSITIGFILFSTTIFLPIISNGDQPDITRNDIVVISPSGYVKVYQDQTVTEVAEKIKQMPAGQEYIILLPVQTILGEGVVIKPTE